MNFGANGNGEEADNTAKFDDIRYLIGKEILEQSPNYCENPQQFIAEIEEVVQQFRSKLNLAQVDVSELLKSVFDLYRKHRVKVEPNFTSVLLGIMVLEGLGRTLDPELDLLWVAGPYVL